MATVAAVAACPVAWASGPQGGVVATGQASVAQEGHRTTVHQSSTRAVIDWRGFDVGRDHHVDFQQPGRHAATLNRIASGGPSTIAGRITAPGTVIVQNNAGVVFSGSARVDVGGLVATSQTVDAARFQAGAGLAIGGGERPGARVANDGSITVAEAGLAALVGSHVANNGTIVARQGTVALASGERTTIDLVGDGLARIVVDGDLAGGGSIVNTGTIDAAGGRVLMSAGDAARTLDAAINTAGVVRAASAEGRGGVIELIGRGSGDVHLAGALEASGAGTGGSVTVTGERVDVAAAARIDTGGGTDGGVVRIGGDRQGAPPLRRSTVTTVAAGAEIDATGAAGAGGSVVVWSDGSTQFDGRIRAGGGAAGGFVETSGAVDLGVGERAEVHAGRGGHWLLDPRDVIIGNPVPGSSTDLVVPPGTTPYLINRLAIIAALNAGSDVTVSTEQPASTMAGDITVTGGVLNWNGDGSLALRADRDVLVSAVVRTQGSGDFSVDAGRNLVIDANVEATGVGNVSLTARTGDIVATNSAAGNRQIFTSGGNLALTAVEGSVLLRRSPGAGNNVQVYSITGPVDIAAGTEILVQGGSNPGTWVRVGRAANPSAVTLRAPVIGVQGGSAGDAFAEVVTGTGGSISLDASDRIVVADGSGSPGRVTALFGSSLSMTAPEQRWDGQVRSGPGFAGGDTVLAGAIAATVTPEFDLAANRSFTLAATTGSGVPSSYVGPAPLEVVTRAAGTITVDAPVATGSIRLVSEEQVALGSMASLVGSDGGDAVVVAAGRRFQNDAGSDVVRTTDPAARWLVYVNGFAGMVGPEPAPRGADLYGRAFAEAPPASLAAFTGNRLVYAEQPILSLTGDTLAKTYGQSVVPGFTVTGLRPGDTLGGAIDGGVAVSSDGAAADAPVAGSPYAVTVDATASDQGYLLQPIDGAITIQPAALTITAADAARLRGSPNPGFTASFDGFVLGETVADLDGGLAFTTAAAVASPVGAYPVTPGGLVSSNYALTFVQGTLVVEPAPLTVTAADAARLANTPNPPFTAIYSGFVLGETPAVLGGDLAFDTPAVVASPPGAFPVTPSGLTSTEYLLSIVPGTLTVTAAPPPAPSPPAPPPPAPAPNGGAGVGALPDLSASIEPFDRGVAPVTPGDASFRTTLTEAGPSSADPFALSFSLGTTVELAPADPTAALGGIAPAAAPEPSDPSLIAEALGAITPGAGTEVADGDVAVAGGCAGPVNTGPAAACGREALVDDFWAAFLGGTP